MNSRSTSLLLFLAVSMAVFIFLFERRQDDSGTRETVVDKLFPEFQPAAVTRVEFARTNLLIRVERTNDTWTLTTPLAYPAQALAINSLVEVCSKLRPQASIPARQVKTLSDFGLQPPTAVLTLQAGTNRLELRVGTPTPVGEQLYVQVAGRDEVLVVDGRLLDWLPRSANDWRDRALMNLAGVPFDRLRVRFGARDLVVQRETNQLWHITNPPPLKRADTPQLNHLVAQMRRWPVVQFVSDDPRAELESLGLQPPDAEMAFASGTNDLLVIQFGRSPTNDTSLVYARRLSHTNVVLVPRVWLERFRVPFWDLCEHRLLDTLPALVFDQIEVRGTDAFALRRGTNGHWRFTAPTSEPADAELVNGLLVGLAEVEAVELAKEVVTDFMSFGLEPPRRRYTLLQTTTNITGAGTNLLVAQVDFGATRIVPDDQTFFARRHDERFVYAVPGGNADLLAHAHYQLRDRKLWNFTTNQVQSVTVTRGGLTNKLTRNSARLWAGLGAPADEVKSAAIDETLARLGQLRAEAWTAKGAASLAAYGFTNNCHKVVIELASADKPQLLSIEFGRQPARRNPYAAVPDPLDAQPVIFEFPAKLLRDLVQPFLNIPSLSGL